MVGETTPSYADIARSFALAEKILKNFGSEAGETNKPDDLMILSTLVRLKDRLDDLSKKIRSAKAVSQVLNIHRKTLIEDKILTEAKIDKGFLKSWTKVRNEARSILKEAAHTEIKLPSVPAGDGTAWSFERLQNWLDESLRKITKLLRKYILKINSGGKIEPLPKKDRLIYEKLKNLKPHEAMTLPEIQDWLYNNHKKNLDEGTWKEIRKRLKPYGLKNKPRIGYFIQK